MTKEQLKKFNELLDEFENTTTEIVYHCDTDSLRRQNTSREMLETFVDNLLKKNDSTS